MNYKRMLTLNDGEERIVKDSLHYGHGYCYTYAFDAAQAGCQEGVDYTRGLNSLFVHLTLSGLKKVSNWLKG